HAGYFLYLAEQAEAAWGTEDQAAWFERLQREQDNLRAALAWSLDPASVPSPGGDLGVRLAAATWWFWPHQGHLREGQEWLARARSRAESAPSRVRAGLLLGSGALLLLQGDVRSARPCLEESLAVFRAVDDRAGMAAALDRSGWASYQQGDLARARTLWEESLSLQRQVGLTAGMINLLRHLRRVVANLGDAEAVNALKEEARTLMRHSGGASAVAA